MHSYHGRSPNSIPLSIGPPCEWHNICKAYAGIPSLTYGTQYANASPMPCMTTLTGVHAHTRSSSLVYSRTGADTLTHCATQQHATQQHATLMPCISPYPVSVSLYILCVLNIGSDIFRFRYTKIPVNTRLCRVMHWV